MGSICDKSSKSSYNVTSVVPIITPGSDRLTSGAGRVIGSSVDDGDSVVVLPGEVHDEKGDHVYVPAEGSTTNEEITDLTTATEPIEEVVEEKPEPPAPIVDDVEPEEPAEPEEVVDNMPVEIAVCKIDDLVDKEMRDFEVEGGRLLLVRDEGEYRAMGAKCTHYGASLAKGSYCSGRVRCPWHGAAFSTVTGDIEDFPGLDSIPVFKTRIDGDSVMVTYEPTALKSSKRELKTVVEAKTNADKVGVVIIGSGGAAMSCAETLRQHGHTGSITMVTRETHLPYDRPKLSKAMTMEAEKMALRPETYFDEHNIKLIRNAPVDSVDMTSKTVRLENGTAFRYTSLVLATGGEPRHLSCEGADAVGVHYLRTPQDSNAIAAEAEGKNVVIVGSSFIGMECAATLVSKAASVTVIGTSPLPLSAVFGKDVGNAVKTLFESKNVHFRLSSGVKSIVSGDDGKVTGVVLVDDQRVDADVVIVGIGVTPATRYLRLSAIELTDSGQVPVDEYLRTTADDVYACGDIVTFPLTCLEHVKDTKVNVQHWQMAMKHGRTAALNIINPESTALDTVPFFWSMFFGKSIRFAGYNRDYDSTVVSGDIDALKFCIYYCVDDTVVAVATCNNDPVAAHIASILHSHTNIRKEVAEECVEQTLKTDAEFWAEWMNT